MWACWILWVACDGREWREGSGMDWWAILVYERACCWCGYAKMICWTASDWCGQQCSFKQCLDSMVELPWLVWRGLLWLIWDWVSGCSQLSISGSFTILDVAPESTYKFGSNFSCKTIVAKPLGISSEGFGWLIFYLIGIARSLLRWRAKLIWREILVVLETRREISTRLKTLPLE